MVIDPFVASRESLLTVISFVTISAIVASFVIASALISVFSAIVFDSGRSTADTSDISRQAKRMRVA
jgi:hypothetical protein